MPREQPCFAHSWEARALPRVAVTRSFAERLSEPFSSCAAAGPPPGQRDTWVTECPLGFLRAGPSVDRSDCSLPGQQLLAPLQLLRGIFTDGVQRGPEFPAWVLDLPVPEPFPIISAPGGLGLFPGNSALPAAPGLYHTSRFVISEVLLIVTLLFFMHLKKKKGKMLLIRSVEGQRL